MFPDGTFTEWTQRHDTKGYVSIDPVDDHLNARDEPWDGHTQGHCGEHVSIFGTDKGLVEEAYLRALNAALTRCDGRCRSKFHAHRGVVDGVTVYDSDWQRFRRAGTGVDEKFVCMHFLDHDWGEWSADREVAPGQTNRSRVCKRCICMELSGSFSLAL